MRAKRTPRQSAPLKRRCIMCSGDGLSYEDNRSPCKTCGGSGVEMLTRDEVWSRDKAFLGSGHPNADSNGREKWVRFAVEVPPELAGLIDAAHRKSLGVNADSASRAGAVRSALRLYLNTVDPEPDFIDGTAKEHIDLPALPKGARP